MQAIVIVFLLFGAVPAYGYLDPGSGNAIISLLFFLFGAVAYGIKTVYYRLTGNKQTASTKRGTVHELVLFSEGKNYRSTFKPIVDALLQQGQRVYYVTCDIEDPILDIEHDLFDAKYLGEGSVAFARLHQIRCRLMVATTPNIGAPGFPLTRPKNAENLAHVCHAVSGLGNYHRFSLDHYDTILMPGEFMRDEVRKIETLRKLKEKSCVAVGLPYLDDLVAKARPRDGESGSRVVLVAPSWGTKNFLHACGTDFLHRIAKAGYEVIVRPHPHSWKVEAPYFDTLAKELAPYKNVTIDREVDGSVSLRRADVMISGKSAVRFDYAFLYKRPVVSVKLSFADDHEYEFSDLGAIWEDEAEAKIGPVVEPGADMERILDVLDEAFRFTATDLETIRELTVVNLGAAGPAVASWCGSYLRQLKTEQR